MNDNNEYSVDEYKNLDNGAQNIDNAINQLHELLQSGTDSNNRIMNESTFCGPVADHCNQVWKIISKATYNDLNNFQNNANVIRDINAGYQESDNKVSKDIGGV